LGKFNPHPQKAPRLKRKFPWKKRGRNPQGSKRFFLASLPEKILEGKINNPK